VTVKLGNRRTDAYEVEEYGDSITVDGVSGYKIKASEGKQRPYVEVIEMRFYSLSMFMNVPNTKFTGYQIFTHSPNRIPTVYQ
jgi:hypothetical protein